MHAVIEERIQSAPAGTKAEPSLQAVRLVKSFASGVVQVHVLQ